MKEKINDHVSKFEDKKNMKDYHDNLQRVEYEDASRNIKAIADDLASRTKSLQSSVSLTLEEKASNMPGSMPMSF